ncbi:hypothetical protein [Pelagibius sp. Alg239-R121]|uniref:T4 family baseplate hub assembly chaperone n=1 Tax=Pelagibius sp. Alg239-R121 TaxID=2993448 RepID=UPI0024A71671|nr:hypothetical protein [Pelagibius sp. Alg239-R121]
MTAALTASGIIAAWETGAGRGPLDRAIAVLWAAAGEADLAALPLAERDRQLLYLRHATFGATLNSVAKCPDCGSQMEIELDVQALAESLAAPKREVFDVEGVQIELRPLNSRDLAAAAYLPETDVTAFIRHQLAGEAVELAPQVLKQIDDLIEEREAAGELNITLSCADCETQWTDQLDVGAHIWREIEAAALRLLGEVGEIAAAFGWAESEILAMSGVRRSAYLNLARSG